MAYSRRPRTSYRSTYRIAKKAARSYVRNSQRYKQRKQKGSIWWIAGAVAVVYFMWKPILAFFTSTAKKAKMAGINNFS